MLKYGCYIIIFTLSLFCLDVVANNNRVDTLSAYTMPMLQTLNTTLIKHINKDKSSSDYGAIDCPHCNLYHTRAAEAVYPFAFEFEKTKNKKYLHAAIDLGNWLVAQQQPNGSWLETPEEWTGTTTDQALMMALAYPILKNHLSQKEKTLWLNSIEKSGDYLVSVMNPQFASINYCATTTATLMYVNEVVRKTAYVEKARDLARKVVAKMDQDYFLTGEGGRVFGAKYGIDLGYNLEMSLWGLTLYAELAKDEVVLSAVEKSLEKHLHFIYPDGSMDASWGIRSNKWTCFGSATSDGCQLLFALFTDQDNKYRTAAIRNLEYLKTCMNDGVIGFGPHYFDLFDDSPCIYPTFAKAKNMAMGTAFVKTDIGIVEDLPLDKNGLAYFPTLNLSQIRTPQWCSTISAYTYKDPAGDRTKYMHRPSGGNICNLWLKDHGYLQASSQTIYKRWEPMSFPEMDSPLPLTPRLEFENERGYFTNLYEFDAIMTSDSLNNVYRVSSIGELKSSKQEEGGIAYRLDHEIGDDYLIKEIELMYHDVNEVVNVVEPIILYPEMTIVQIDEKTVDIKLKDKTVRYELLSDDGELILGQNANRYKWVYPALQAYPITLKLNNSANNLRQKVCIRYTIS